MDQRVVHRQRLEHDRPPQSRAAVPAADAAGQHRGDAAARARRQSAAPVQPQRREREGIRHGQGREPAQDIAGLLGEY